MESKSDKVREYVSNGEFQKALAIVKTFRLGITKEQHDALLLAYECLLYPDFYKQLGRNVEDSIAYGISLLKSFYG